ncbi:MAG: histidine kinase dimerization/phospho-acceptor domain-containing protein [Bacilli bacterium]
MTDASHEIKTPLSVIKSTCEVIEMESGQNEWAEIIEKQVLRLSQLTECIVFYQRWKKTI